MEKKSGRPRMIGPQTKRTSQAEDCRKRKLKEAALEGDEKIKRMQHDFDEGKNRIAQLERMIQMIHQEWKLKYQKLERELTMVKRALQRPTYLGMQGSLEQNYNGSYSDPEMGFARLDPQMVHHQGYDTSAQHQNSYEHPLQTPANFPSLHVPSQSLTQQPEVQIGYRAPVTRPQYMGACQGVAQRPNNMMSSGSRFARQLQEPTGQNDRCQEFTDMPSMELFSPMMNAPVHNSYGNSTPDQQPQSSNAPSLHTPSQNLTQQPEVQTSYRAPLPRPQYFGAQGVAQTPNMMIFNNGVGSQSQQPDARPYFSEGSAQVPTAHGFDSQFQTHPSFAAPQAPQTSEGRRPMESGYPVSGQATGYGTVLSAFPCRNDQAIGME